MKKIVGVFIVILLSTTVMLAQSFKSFGAEFVKSNAISAKDLRKLDLGNLDNLQVEGEVNAVCQAAGCWMTIKLENGETMRVTFKDYGFFVPKDLAGSKVVFKGKPEVTETSVAELKHYAADAGKSKKEIEAINEPEIALTFVADGVLVPR